MSQPDQTSPAVDTFDTAIAHAIRLLHAAEFETNLALMERLGQLADSWLTVAGMINHRDECGAGQ